MANLVTKLANCIKSAAAWIVAKLCQIPTDKVRHFAVGAILSFISILVPLAFGVKPWFSIIISEACVFGLCWYKERVMDTKLSTGDIVATVAGAMTIWVAVLVVMIVIG